MKERSRRKRGEWLERATTAGGRRGEGEGQKPEVPQGRKKKELKRTSANKAGGKAAKDDRQRRVGLKIDSGKEGRT